MVINLEHACEVTCHIQMLCLLNKCYLHWVVTILNSELLKDKMKLPSHLNLQTAAVLNLIILQGSDCHIKVKSHRNNAKVCPSYFTGFLFNSILFKSNSQNSDLMRIIQYYIKRLFQVVFPYSQCSKCLYLLFKINKLMLLYKGWREKVKNSNFKLKTFAISYFNLYQKLLNASSLIFYLEQRGV